MLTRSDNSPELVAHIDKLENIHKNFLADIEGFSSLREFITQTNEIDFMELDNKDANPAGKNRDNGSTPPLATHTYSPSSPPIDNK